MNYDGTPAVIPAGWQVKESAGCRLLFRQMPNGLKATFSEEHYADESRPMGPGTYRRVVLSRRNMYPTWDEMRDFIRTCGLFDRSRDVIMLLPPDRDYVSLHPNAFHWLQKVNP
jgi:hypothetical protein